MRWVLLFVLASAVAVQASRFGADGMSPSASRHLLLSPECPSYCEVGKCVLDRSQGGYRCSDCVNNLIVTKTTGECGCPVGRYFDDGTETCKDCEVGSYCPGGAQNTVTSTNNATMTPCGTGLTTKTKRARSAALCVNAPGYRYVGGLTPSAVQCSGNTYNVGMFKQKTCTRCPAGFVIQGSNSTDMDSASDCKVPPGYYLKGVGQVAPCPQGEYKSGYTSPKSCTSCPEGVTTADKASTSASACNVMEAGWFPEAMSNGGVTSAKECLAGYYCPGGAVTAAVDLGALDSATMGMASCDEDFTMNGLQTRGMGATSDVECGVPPGMFLNTTSNTIEECPDGTYRSGWTRATDPATSCVSCGTGPGISSEKNDIFYTFAANGSKIANEVRGGPGSCVLEAGYGLYYTVNNADGSYVYRSMACNNNSYGNPEQLKGLTAAPCKLCPTNMVTAGSAAQYNIDGRYIDPLACVTQAGYGWDGRVSTKCGRGTYNAAGNYKQCSKCGFGLTTADDGADDETDCGIAPGYGYVDNRIQECPLGTYNPTYQASRTATCTACTGNKMTSEIGGDTADACDVCAPGFGGDDINSCADCSAVNGYGSSSRAPGDTECTACPVMSIGYSFFYGGNDQTYISPAVSRPEADSASDCLNKWAQIGDGLWYFAGASAAGGGHADLDACLTYCAGQTNCHFATFDYAGGVGNKCYVYTSPASPATGGAYLAYKSVPSGDVTAASVKNKPQNAPSSGVYTQYSVDTVADGLTLPGATSSDYSTVSKSTCFAQCDMTADCAGVYLEDSDPQDDTITACKLLFGTSEVQHANAAKRSLTQAVPSLMNLAA